MRSLKTICFFIIVIGLMGCKTNQFKNKQKQGRWIYRDTVNGIIYLTKGKYHNGSEKKIWKYYAGRQLIKKENYKKDICYVTTYHSNGAIAAQGKTKSVMTETEIHWYYFDRWYYFEPNGRMTTIKEYENGALIRETMVP